MARTSQEVAMLRVVLVFLASGVGGASRYLLGGKIQQALGAVFPYGTMTINISGSFLIALFMGLSLRTTWMSVETRLLLTTGFCGGYTTYSTFNYETLTLAQEGAWGFAAAYIGATVLGCLIAGVLGLWLSRAIAG